MPWYFTLDCNALRNAEAAGIARAGCSENRNRARSLILREMHAMAVAEEALDDAAAMRHANRIQDLATQLRDHLGEYGL